MLSKEDFDSHSEKELFKEVLNSKLSKSRHDSLMDAIEYESELLKLQAELVDLQQWAAKHKKRICILFEGRDAAGKGGAIRRAIQHLNPRHLQVVALDVPSADEKKQWFFQRYINHLPKPGEIVFFDRSWCNRAVVEPVNGFCTQKQYETFMGQVNEFEKMLIESDTYIIKIYFSISKEEQAKRFEEIKTNPLKQWKITPVDLRAQELWDTYTHYKKMMFAKTHSAHAPWHIIEANPKMNARLEALELILNTIPYESKN